MKAEIKIPELVLPGGDLERVKIALDYGADAVYLGLAPYSLRKAEVNFTIAKIKQAIKISHRLNKKIYVTFNIFAHEDQLSSIKNDLLKIAKLKPDAFIISDPGIINLAKNLAANIPIHLSTQANTLNSESVKFWQKQGIKRIVLARETTISDIQKIKKHCPKIELEVFVHGAMCISYSGRCLLSSYLTGRSANLGICAQPCRWNYKVYLEEETRPGELIELKEDKKGSYLMSSKDLCLIEYIDELAKAGVDAFKIEGRNKTEYYVAITAKIYRRALNLYKIGKYTKKEKMTLKQELKQLAHRDYTTGFLLESDKKGDTYDSRQPIYGKKYVGFVKNITKDGWAEVVVKNKIKASKEYEVITPQETFKTKVISIKEENGKIINEANPGETNKKVFLRTSRSLSKNTFIRDA